MDSYTKILTYFIKINGHRTIKQHYNSNYYYYYFSSKKKINIDLNKSLISIYNCLKIINKIKNNKCTILIVGNIKEFIYFIPFFNVKSNSFFVISKWINGLISNWDVFNYYIKTSFKKDYFKIKKSKKLRFIRYFFCLLNFKKPDLIIVSKVKQYNNIFFEAKNESIPVIYIGDDSKYKNITSYHIPVNIKNFYINLFIIQLISSEMISIKKNA